MSFLSLLFNILRIYILGSNPGSRDRWAGFPSKFLESTEIVPPTVLLSQEVRGEIHAEDVLKHLPWWLLHHRFAPQYSSWSANHPPTLHLKKEEDRNGWEKRSECFCTCRFSCRHFSIDLSRRYLIVFYGRIFLSRKLNRFSTERFPKRCPFIGGATITCLFARCFTGSAVLHLGSCACVEDESFCVAVFRGV